MFTKNKLLKNKYKKNLNNTAYTKFKHCIGLWWPLGWRPVLCLNRNLGWQLSKKTEACGMWVVKNFKE